MPQLQVRLWYEAHSLTLKAANLTGRKHHAPQMASARYEDVLSVALGLFQASYVFDQPAEGPTQQPHHTISAFVLKTWQVCLDLMPTCPQLWVKPTPSRAVAPVYSTLYSNGTSLTRECLAAASILPRRSKMMSFQMSEADLIHHHSTMFSRYEEQAA